MNTNPTNHSNDANDSNHPNSKGPSPDNFGCDSYADELALFVFGELDEVSAERVAALEHHLVGCTACRGERDALLRSLELLKQEGGADTSAPQLSEARRANLLAQAQAAVKSGELAPSKRSALLLSRVLLAASVIAVAGTAWYAVEEIGTKRQARPRDSLTMAQGNLIKVDGDHPERDSNHYTLDALKNERGDVERASLLASLEKGETIDRTSKPEEAPAPKTLLESQLVIRGGHEAPPADPLGAVSDGDEGNAAGAFFKNTDKYDAKAPTEHALNAPDATKPDGAQVEEGFGALLAPQGPTANPQLRLREEARVEALSRKGESLRREQESKPSTKSLNALGYLGGEDAVEDLIDLLDESQQALPAQQVSPATTSLAIAPDPQASVGAASASSGLGGFGRGWGFSDDAQCLGALLAASVSPAQVLQIESKLRTLLAAAPVRPVSEVAKDRDTIVREFLDQLSRRKSEPPHDMFFRYFGDHPFIPTRIDCKSTFGMDVDTASYSLVRAYLTKGTLPPKAAVRTEEFVNSFKHELASTERDTAGLDRDPRDVFSIHTEAAPSPFGGEGQYLLRVGVKAREISKAARKPLALTFVIDVSGSMEQDGRLELVKQSLRLLLDQLDERDSVGIITFETTAHRVLDPTNASERARILAALDPLRPAGSTNADDGLRQGYQMALEQLRANGENRVILCSDGVANTGVTDPKWLSARIAECKSKYIYLNCVGVGMGNHNDALMEQLADEGDGFCAYMDRIEEGRKIFVEKLTSTMFTVARNAKIQVEFDPAGVRRFRQLGYENRALAHRDFRNDKVDAGEVGAGQEVVALYEFEPLAGAAGPIATVRVRYEDPQASQERGAAAPQIREQARVAFAIESLPTVQQASPRFRLAACVAEFAEILRQSVHARDGSLVAVERFAEPLVDELRGDPDVPEFVALVKQAARLPDLLPARSELTRACDEIKKVRCWQEELNDRRDAKDAADDELMKQLEEQNRRLEQALRDALDRALRR